MKKSLSLFAAVILSGFLMMGCSKETKPVAAPLVPGNPVNDDADELGDEEILKKVTDVKWCQLNSNPAMTWFFNRHGNGERMKLGSNDQIVELKKILWELKKKKFQVYLSDGKKLLFERNIEIKYDVGSGSDHMIWTPIKQAAPPCTGPTCASEPAGDSTVLVECNK